MAGLHIVVCVKSVIMRAPKGKVLRGSDTCELNPFDRPALETAMDLKEMWGGMVTALSMGPPSSAFVLHEAMALGVDRGVLVCDPALAGSDTLATSRTLGAAIRKLLPFDLVLFGTRSADSDTGQVGPETATFLDMPLVSGIHAIERDGEGLLVERKADGFREKYRVLLPAFFTVQAASGQPRDAGLAGIEDAYGHGEVTTWNLADLDLSPEQVGQAGSPTRVISMSPVKRGRQCELLSGATEDQADALVKRLSESGLL